MEEIVWAGNLALGPNLSVVMLNRSFPSLWVAPGQPGRMISATAILLLALVGNCLLLHRLHCGGCCCEGRFGRRRKMDFLLAHLAVASLYGCGLALFSHFPAVAGHAEQGEGAPPGHAEGSSSGDATCRLLRLLQGSGLLAPSHMLVLIALERHHMAKGPSPPPRPPSPSQRKPWLPSSRPAQGTLAALGWLLAVLLALPQAFVYRLTPPERGGRCLSIFAQLPRWQGQTYAVYGAITGFVAPACFLGGTCGGIISALSSTASTKEKEPARGAPAAAAAASSSAPQSRVRLPGDGDGSTSPAPVPSRSRLLLCLLPAAKCALPSLPAAAAPRSLPRARARALQLTLALTTVFALCGFPRFLLELGLAFASSESGVDDSRTSLGSLMAATNSAVNPYVCLLFNSHQPWARHVQRRLCCCPHGQPRRRAHHRHHPPPQAVTDGRPGRWLCPCQSRPPTVSTIVQQEEIEAQPLDPCESRF